MLSCFTGSRAARSAALFFVYSSVVFGFAGLVAPFLCNAIGTAQAQISGVDEVQAQHDGSLLARTTNEAVRWHCITKARFEAISAQADKYIATLTAAIAQDRSGIDQVPQQQPESQAGQNRRARHIDSLRNEIGRDLEVISDLQIAVARASHNLCPPETPAGGGGGVRFGPHWVLADAQPFVGFNVGGGFSGTSFSVDPTFNVSGSGVMAGGFGGLLFPVPNSMSELGFRLGGEGGWIRGNIMMPPASPLFTYTVTTNWMAYQEALSKTYIQLGGLTPPHTFFTISAGIAETGAAIKGTSGAFSVTDNALRTGLTFTAGVGIPIAMLPNRVDVELFAQWRGTQWESNAWIPGNVVTASFTNEIGVGFNFTLPPPPPPPPPP